CAIEMMATACARFDIARFGAEVMRFSPRQSDVMIDGRHSYLQNGPRSQTNLRPDAGTQWVIAMGACASPRSYGVGFRRGESNRPKKEICRPLHHFLRILFLVALFPVRAFLLHLSKRLCHVFDLIPNIKAYVDRGVLRSRHRDTIAGPRIDLDDLLLLRFVLCTEDKSRKIGTALEIVDDHPFDLRSKRAQDVR